MAWDDLRFFLAVLDGGSLTVAAKSTASSIATVGRRVEALERELGGRLFERSQGGYAPTALGLSLLGHARDVRASIEKMSGLARVSAAAGQTVRVATTEDMAVAFLCRMLPKFREQNANITLHLDTEMASADLGRNHIDIALRQIRPQAGNALIRRVGSWGLGLYASKLYAERTGLGPGVFDKSKVALISWSEEWEPFRGRPWMRRFVADAPIALIANSRRVQHAACRAGLGVAILPTYFGDQDRELVCVLPSDEVVNLPIWILVRREVARQNAIRKVVEFLKKAVQRPMNAQDGLF
jgi:DNA-binding transcriptional LysR family regulator